MNNNQKLNACHTAAVIGSIVLLVISLGLYAKLMPPRSETPHLVADFLFVLYVWGLILFSIKFRWIDQELFPTVSADGAILVNPGGVSGLPLLWGKDCAFISPENPSAPNTTLLRKAGRDVGRDFCTYGPELASCDLALILQLIRQGDKPVESVEFVMRPLVGRFSGVPTGQWVAGGMQGYSKGSPAWRRVNLLAADVRLLLMQATLQRLPIAEPDGAKEMSSADILSTQPLASTNPGAEIGRALRSDKPAPVVIDPFQTQQEDPYGGGRLTGQARRNLKAVVHASFYGMGADGKHNPDVWLPKPTGPGVWHVRDTSGDETIIPVVHRADVTVIEGKLHARVALLAETSTDVAEFGPEFEWRYDAKESRGWVEFPDRAGNWRVQNRIGEVFDVQVFDVDGRLFASQTAHSMGPWTDVKFWPSKTRWLDMNIPSHG